MTQFQDAEMTQFEDAETTQFKMSIRVAASK
jgi:hypothetical protein